MAETLAQAVGDIAAEAGRLAHARYGQDVRKWEKSPDNFVCEVDLAVDELLRARLSALLPDAGWLSEETADDLARLSCPRVWVVDPIDGTRAFMAGREDWTISAALVVAGRPVAAALYAPVTRELFLATAGGGATRNGEVIGVTNGGLNGARIGGPKRVLDRMVAAGAGVAPMPRIHSLALRLARVADGSLDAAMAGGNGHDWDLAAADLLVHEAGGVMTALDGRTLIYNRPEPVHGVLIAAGRERHAALVDLVRAQTSEPG